MLTESWWRLKSNKDRTKTNIETADQSYSFTVCIHWKGRTNPIAFDTHGVLSVNLADIDDFNNVDCLAETYNPAVRLTENNGRLVSFAGNAIFSGDGGKTWHQEALFTREKGLPYGRPGGDM